MIPTPAAATIAPATIVLAAEAQAKPSRPTLDSIKSAAASKGISLEAAVETYVAAAPQAANNWPDGPVTLPDVMVDDLSANFLDDLKAMARDFGITFAEAIDRHGWMPGYKEVAGELKSKYPNDFAGVEREPDGSAVWIGFKGKVPAEALLLAKKIPTRVTLAGDLGYSEVELAATKEDTHQVLRNDPDVAHVASSYDVKTGTILARVQPRSRRAVLAERLNTVKTSNNPRIRRATEITDSIEIQQHDYIRGGGFLNGCTSGFNLKYRTTATKRHGTAGHCAAGSSTNRYCNQTGGGGCTSISRVWYTESYGDIGYYTTGSFTPTRTFYYNWSATRYVDWQDPYPAKGDSVCKFGRTTGRTCTTIYDTDHSVDGTSHLTVSNMLHPNNCDKGDSGGPWYIGGAGAYGIHMGSIRYSGGTYYRCTTTHVKWYGEARDYLVYER